MDSTVKEVKYQGEKGGQARRTSLGEVEESIVLVSERKSSPRGSAESWFHSSLARPEIGKQVGRRRVRS